MQRVNFSDPGAPFHFIPLSAKDNVFSLAFSITPGGRALRVHMALIYMHIFPEISHIFSRRDRLSMIHYCLIQLGYAIC